MRDTKNRRSDAKPTPYLDYAEQLFGNGFTPLPADGKAVKLRDWRHFVMPSDEDERARFIEKNECKNIGLRTGRLVAIDNDNDDPKRASDVRELVFSICGYTPFVRTVYGFMASASNLHLPLTISLTYRCHSSLSLQRHCDFVKRQSAKSLISRLAQRESTTLTL